MSLGRQRLIRALTRNHAETSADADDPRLLGRTYAVPYEKIWQAALALAGGALHGWRLRSADDLAGVINARAQSRFLGYADIRVRVSLDEDAQTRVDARSITRSRRADLGANARRLHHFFRQLDRQLARDRAPADADGRTEPTNHQPP